MTIRSYAQNKFVNACHTCGSHSNVNYLFSLTNLIGAGQYIKLQLVQSQRTAWNGIFPKPCKQILHFFDSLIVKYINLYQHRKNKVSIYIISNNIFISSQPWQR